MPNDIIVDEPAADFDYDAAELRARDRAATDIGCDPSDVNLTVVYSNHIPEGDFSRSGVARSPPRVSMKFRYEP